MKKKQVNVLKKLKYSFYASKGLTCLMSRSGQRFHYH